MLTNFKVSRTTSTIQFWCQAIFSRASATCSYSTCSCSWMEKEEFVIRQQIVRAGFLGLFCFCPPPPTHNGVFAYCLLFIHLHIQLLTNAIYNLMIIYSIFWVGCKQNIFSSRQNYINNFWFSGRKGKESSWKMQQTVWNVGTVAATSMCNRLQSYPWFVH